MRDPGTHRICALCVDGGLRDDGTPKCKRGERTRSPYSSQCDGYKHSTQAAFTREEVERLIKDAAKPAPIKKEIAYDLLPRVELRAEGFPPAAVIDFLNADLADEHDMLGLLDRYFRPYVSEYALNTAKQLGLERELVQAQKDLRAVAEGKAGLEVLNPYFRGVSIELVAGETEKEGMTFLRTKSVFAGPLPGALSEGFGPIGMFFVQAAEWWLKAQPPRVAKCPVCDTYFERPKRGPKGRTCGKKACKIAMSKNPQRFLETV